MSKTKKVAGVDLDAKCFAFVGDPEDIFTWKLPLHVPGDTGRTINLVKNALSRFDETKGIPASRRRATYMLLCGAAIALGIPAQREKVVEITEDEIDMLLAERAAHRLVEQIDKNEWGTR